MGFSNLKKKNILQNFTFFLSLLFALVLPLIVNADVSIIKGPTPVQSGDAVSENDITLKNTKIAVSFAAKNF
jgi:hypothetical protein